MQKLIRSFRVLDYVVGAGTVGYGFYAHEPLIVGLGVAGLALAKFNLAQRLSTKLQNYFLRKKTPLPLAPLDDDEAAAQPVSAVSEPQLPPANYAQQRLVVGALRVGSSRHSVLRSETALNHAEPRNG